ncbi:MAG TPA: short-chain dehydrogenase [Erysipelotrichaceae bacterium]|nr:short-chain dehydrogenase [Erysipelotrichaceae bacterium]
MNIRDKVFVVTDGGNGIGREVVLNLMSKGASVGAVDISQDGLDETKAHSSLFATNLSLHKVDISDRAAVEALVHDVEKYHGVVDGIINVAGIIQPFVRVSDLDYDRIERVMNVNFYGTLSMVKSFLPSLIQRPQAHILNVSSMGGFIPVPGQTIYGASKAAVKLLTEGLRSELLETNVGVTIVFPGGVATDITKNSGADRKAALPEGSSKMKLITASEAAAIMVDAIEKNKYQVYAGKDSSMLNLMTKFAPKKAAAVIADKLKSIIQ